MSWIGARGPWLLLLAALGWSGLSLWLGVSGLAPTRAPWLGVKLLRVAPEDWYFAQALLIPAVLTAQVLVMARVGVWFAQRRGVVMRAARFARPLAGSLGLSLLLGLVIPDLLAFALWGQDGLRSALRVTALATPVLALALVSATVRRVLITGWLASVGIAWVMLLLQAVLGGLLLR
ncbi:MAG: hypothetical protein KIT72_15040 [Polyangiaceae bacterium]|nr:hypothetical protein [Polyangiaceae bacterium]MCW5791732.1 hypothetical protein [Polyangiaceae bacterium]